MCAAPGGGALSLTCTLVVSTTQQEVQKAWAIGDTAQEKEKAAQRVILLLKQEIGNLRTQISDLNKYVHGRILVIARFVVRPASRPLLLLRSHLFCRAEPCPSSLRT